jgi:diguanylate cyclase (GGDEF)-like protein
MVPIVALSVMGGLDAVQHSRDADAASGLAAQVGRVEQALRVYANLFAEKVATEAVLVAEQTYGLSPTQGSRLSGVDLVAQLQSSRSALDAAMTSGVDATLRKRLAQLPALRAKVDAGTLSEAAAQVWFVDTIDLAASSWLTEVTAATSIAATTPGSSDVRRATSALADAADALIAGTEATSAAGALTIAGIPGAATAPQDLAGAQALYVHASAGLRAELSGRTRAAWERLVVDDPDTLRFQQFVTTLLAQPPSTTPATPAADAASIFGAGLTFQRHLRDITERTAGDVVRLARELRSAAQDDLRRYLLGLGAIAAISIAVAVLTARAIVRPLQRLARRASALNHGVISGDPLDTGGPYEVAVVSAAVNEIVTNLRLVETTALALAASDLDNPVLAAPVPGAIGESLHASVDALSRSIRENEELRHRLEVSAAQFHELADRTPDIIWQFSLDPRPHFEYLSPSFETHTGIPVSSVQADVDVFADALEPASRTLLTDLMTGRRHSSNFDVTLRRSDGTAATFEVHVSDAQDGIQGVARDVTELRALQARLADQATRDPLTGLANRRLLDELLDRALRRAARSGAHLAVAFLDLDDFKAVNDTFGHEAGDTILRVTAARLQTALRDADVVARYGGDEFIIVCEAVDDDAVERLGERIEAALAAPVDLGNGTFVHCPPSLGIASTHAGEHEPGELIDAADRAMLEVKRARHRHATL